MVYKHFGAWIIYACNIDGLHDNKYHFYREDRVNKKNSIEFRNFFLVLTFIGGGYVFINHGQVNAGYAVVPGIWTMICFAYYRSGKHG